MTRQALMSALLISGLLLSPWLAVARCQSQDRSCCPGSARIATPGCCNTKLNPIPPSAATVVDRVVQALAPEVTPDSGLEIVQSVRLSALHPYPVHAIASRPVLRL